MNYSKIKKRKFEVKKLRKANNVSYGVAWSHQYKSS